MSARFFRSFFGKRQTDGESTTAEAAERPRLIIGIGNPGKDNALNRHNVGFWLVNRLARRYQIALKTHTSLVSMGEGKIERYDVVLAKPRTYVNRSGEAVAALARRYRVNPQEILVVCDSLDLPVGAMRLRPAGSHGGHKGLRSVISRLGVSGFPRIRIGIGRPLRNGEPVYDPSAIADYVLSDPPRDERALLDEAVARAIEAIGCMMTEGLETAMNRYNT